MGVVKLSILGGCAALVLAASAAAAPVGSVRSDRLGLSAPVETAGYCRHRRHVRRAPRCSDDYDAACLSEPVVVEEPAYFDYGPPVVLEEPVPCCALPAPVVVAPVDPGFGYYSYAAPVEVVVPSGDYCATPVKTCLLREPGVLGTGCSCHIPGGIARGVVE